jgi:hypothetical protein
MTSMRVFPGYEEDGSARKGRMEEARGRRERGMIYKGVEWREPFLLASWRAALQQVRGS